MNDFTFSIITICFNNLEELKKTCRSVDIQTEYPLEHLIIDGSTGGEIREYLENTPQPHYRRWICERDNGISDAFNKGIQNASGTVTLLLNSGDTLYDKEVIQVVARAFAAHPEVMWIHGKMQTRRGGIWVAVGKPFDKRKLYRGMRGVFHPTMFVKRSLYLRYGYFDTGLKMAMDYDFLCRIAGEPSLFLPRPLTVFDPGGVSSTKYHEAMKEARAVYRKHFGYTVKQTLWGWRLGLLHFLLESGPGKLLYRLKVWIGLENA